MNLDFDLVGIGVGYCIPQIGSSYDIIHELLEDAIYNQVEVPIVNLLVNKLNKIKEVLK